MSEHEPHSFTEPGSWPLREGRMVLLAEGDGWMQVFITDMVNFTRLKVRCWLDNTSP